LNERQINVTKWLKNLYRYYLASFNDHFKPIKNVLSLKTAEIQAFENLKNFYWILNILNILYGKNHGHVDHVQHVGHVDRVRHVGHVQHVPNHVQHVDHVQYFDHVQHVGRVHHVDHVEQVDRVQHGGHPETEVDDNIKFCNKSGDKVPFIILRIFRLMVRLKVKMELQIVDGYVYRYKSAAGGAA
jgi:hypothetical protein